MTKTARLFPDGLLGLPPLKLSNVAILQRSRPAQDPERPWHERTWSEVSEEGWLPADNDDM